MPAQSNKLTRRHCLRVLSAGAGGLVGSGGLAGCRTRPDSPADLPQAAPGRILWGDVHTHTNLSDGKGSLDDLLTHARDEAKLDFIIVTDHDFGNAAPWRMPKREWILTQDKADEYTQPGRFVVIAGYEWTSQAKYWTDVPPGKPSERLFPGRPKNYNHKCVYFPTRVERISSAKDAASNTPDSLAEAVAAHGGLVHHAHPTEKPDCLDQWECQRRHDAVMCNTEIFPDSIWYKGKLYDSGSERAVQQFLAAGARCGFVGGSDTHECRPQARTALPGCELTREAIFDALRSRRNYSVFASRISLDFRIDGQAMGGDVIAAAGPRLTVAVQGTAPLADVSIIRNGKALASRRSANQRLSWSLADETLSGPAWYYVRVTQGDRDEYGNPSMAWSSPIWVQSRAPGPSSEADS